MGLSDITPLRDDLVWPLIAAEILKSSTFGPSSLYLYKKRDEIILPQSSPIAFSSTKEALGEASTAPPLSPSSSLKYGSSGMIPRKEGENVISAL